MKRFSLLTNYLFLLLGVAVLSFTSCGEDGPLGGEASPSVRFADNGFGSLTSDAEVEQDEEFTLNIIGNTGGVDAGALTLLTITENGSNVPLSRITSSDIGANPASVLGDNTTGFDWEVTITAPNAAGTYEYIAILRDANSKTDEASIEVTVTDVMTPPTINYMGADPFLANLGANNFNITANPGSENLATLAVKKDGALITDLTKIDFRGANFSANPLPLSVNDADGFDMANVLIRLTEAGNFVYTFEITDDEGQMATADVTVNVSTDITAEYTGILVSNADGPNQGGLDLDTGMSVAATSTEAEIRDKGIDTNLSAATNWIQKIEQRNTAELRSADASQPELFTFTNINSREAIIAAFDAGVATPTSGKVEQGNVFIVKRADNYYLLEAAEVNIITTDNTDNYKFNIKSSIN